MQRLRLYDIRLSTLPGDIGLCSSDIVGIAAAVNAAQRRLITCREAGDEGWWGTWAEMAFSVDQNNPFLTTPRNVARIESMNLCRREHPVQNQFYEYLQFGNGRLPKLNQHRHGHRIQQAYQRNNAVSFKDISNPPQLIAIYATDPDDMDGTHRVLLQGLDPGNNVVRSQDGLFQVQGQYVTLGPSAVFSTVPFNVLTGIQKDITAGPIQIFQADPVTGNQVLIHTMEPTEQTAMYARYYFDNLPVTCCSNPVTPIPQFVAPQPLEVLAIVKLDLIPVVADPDYTLIQNLEALNEECQSIRYSKMDLPNAVKMSQDHHITAIRLLNGELTHYLGLDTPAVQQAVFGSARLARRRIGTMV